MKSTLTVLLLLATCLSQGATTRISLGPGAVEANGGCTVHDITPNGRFVVYSSVASNLVADDTNGFEDIFLYDTVNDTTELVSVSDNEIQGNNESTQATVSDDGRYVCFTSRASNLVSGDGNAASDVFVRDRQDLLTIRVSISDTELQGNGASVIGKISGNGLVVAFQSVATNS